VGTQQLRCRHGAWSSDGRCAPSCVTAATVPTVRVTLPEHTPTDTPTPTPDASPTHALHASAERIAYDDHVIYRWQGDATEVDGFPAHRMHELVVHDDGTTTVGTFNLVSHPAGFTVIDRSEHGYPTVVPPAATAADDTLAQRAEDTVDQLPGLLQRDPHAAQAFLPRSTSHTPTNDQ